ncbi:MAG: alpha/beta hydrolase [Kiritimatiellae bacterium]|nr:alpha/beta hydrolase [Kiritimatiellia bacterium]
MAKSVIKSLERIFCGIAVGALLVGTGCINSLMFHPETCRGGYDETTGGYVDIGTNGVRVAAIVLGPERGKKAVIRCHGNAEDAAGSLFLLGDLAAHGFTVACVDYPGYGLSDGSPGEKGCYRNVHRLYDWLVETRGFKPDDIIVDGFSVGTGPAVELAATRPVGGLVLEAPFLSAPRVVTGVRLLPVDPFPNLKKIGDVKCPLLLIHGTDDSVIPVRHGKELFKRAKSPKRLILVRGADHNDLALAMGPGRYLRTIEEFATVERVGVGAEDPHGRR